MKGKRMGKQGYQEYVKEHYEQRKEKRRQYYEKNRYRLCDNSLNYYCPRAIGQIAKLCPDAVNEYYSRYPFESMANYPSKSS